MSPPGPSLFVLLLASALSAVSVAVGQPAEPEQIGSLAFDGGRTVSYGEVYQFGEVESVFRFANRGSEPVEVLGVEFALLGGEASWEPQVVEPGGQGEVRIRQPVGEKLGAFTLRHGLRTTDPQAPRIKLSAAGFILSAFEPEVGRLELGRVDRAQGRRATFELTSREAESFGPVRVLQAPDWLTVTPGHPAGQTVPVAVEVGTGAPLGFHIVQVELATGLARQPNYRLEVRAAIHGEVVPSSDPVQLGVMRQFQPFEHRVTLRHLGGEAIEVEQIEGREPFTVGEQECPHPSGVPADPACRLLVLRAEPEVRGAVDVTLLIHLTGRDEPIPVRVSGLVAGPGTVVQDLGELELGTVIHSDGRVERLGDNRSVAPPGVPVVPVSPSRASGDEPVPSGGGAMPAAAGGGPRPPQAKLVWRVRGEARVYGFLVYRGERRSGPFVRINRSIIRADAGPAPEGRYEFLDQDVEPGRTYYYYIDTVARSGLKSRLTGVVAKTVAPGGDAGGAG